MNMKVVSWATKRIIKHEIMTNNEKGNIKKQI